MARYRNETPLERHTRSAANAGWAGAGAGAVGALQAARGARATEELAALARVDSQRSADAAEQTRLFQFSTWRQSGEGVAFMAWRDPAFRLAQFLRNRESEWSQGWAQVIARAQSETSDSDKHRIMSYPGRLRQTAFTIFSVISFILAVVFGLGMLFQMFIGAINPAASTPIAGQAIPAALFLGLGVALLVVRAVKRRAARMDRTLANEAQARTDRWGFDPMAATPGYTPFTWSESASMNGYADRLMTLALYDGHGRPPTTSHLIQLSVPSPHQPHDAHPAEANALLIRFAAERPAF